MSFITNIRSVAKYESKILVRSWFFRIFTLLAVVFLGFFNFAMMLMEDNSAWFANGFIQYTLSEPFVVEYGTGGGRSFPFFRISEKGQEARYFRGLLCPAAQ